ncbi:MULTISPECIES: toxin-antitoxin system YwqK family antitoxin [Fusobacterium]|uniref:toxin-antitoxin system YwqK family antitoxin n=1 Tax=Fusobacterium TaxID=848 RepID=UPI0014770FAB|nr:MULTISPECIES: toxin-antitoxin system YwqK family antitoxin [Fusobacterium]NME35888.1 toxin-antitoxin system YwqK family antitoxin [Fusobacterium sp. FSA-380-WT-3A]
MKKILCFFSLIFSFSFSQNIKLEESNGILLNKENKKPFTGTLKDGKDRQYFHKGRADGKWLSFYSNGKLKTIENWKDGKLDGKYIVYTEEGKKYMEIFYDKGIEDGHYKLFNLDGSPRIVGRFKNGKATGKWKRYN